MIVQLKHDLQLPFDGYIKCDLSCFIPSGMIALNHSAVYMIEPLANHSVSRGHAVFRAESLKIPMSTCNQHYGGENRTDKLSELVGGIALAGHGTRVNTCQILLFIFVTDANVK